MKTKSELIVNLSDSTTSGQMEPEERFNLCYVCCCAWIQYGYPRTREGIKQLEKTKEWDTRDTDLYLAAVEKMGVPEGRWIDQLCQPPADNLWGVYNLYLEGVMGIALAVRGLAIIPTFPPPRKNSERCEGYIFNPLAGLVRIRSLGISSFDEIFRQTIVDLAAEALAPRDQSLRQDLCWSDITKHASFTIAANSRGKGTVKFR